MSDPRFLPLGMKCSEKRIDGVLEVVGNCKKERKAEEAGGKYRRAEWRGGESIGRGGTRVGKKAGSDGEEEKSMDEGVEGRGRDGRGEGGEEGWIGEREGGWGGKAYEEEGGKG